MPELGPTDAFDLLVETCPSWFATDATDRYVAALEEDGGPDLYVRSSALAHHLVDLVVAGRSAEAAATLAALDDVLTGGDADAVALARMGVLEPLHNIASHHDVPVEDHTVRGLLGPAARREWDLSTALWDRAGDVVRAAPTPRATEDDYRAIADPDLRRWFQANRRRLVDGTFVGAGDVLHLERAELAALRRRVRPLVALAIAVTVLTALVAAADLLR